MRIKEERKLLINNKEHLERKQDPFLQFRTFSYHKNRRIELYNRNNVLTRRRIHNI